MLPCGTISWLSAAMMLFSIGASSLLLRTEKKNVRETAVAVSWKHNVK